MRGKIDTLAWFSLFNTNILIFFSFISTSQHLFILLQLKTKLTSKNESFILKKNEKISSSIAYADVGMGRQRNGLIKG